MEYLTYILDAVTLAVVAGWLLVWRLGRKSIEAAAVRAAQIAVEKKYREWEVRFSVLHERRLRAMDGMLDRLVELKRTLDAVSGIQPVDDPAGERLLPELAEAGNDADRFFSARRYYFPPASEQRISAFLDEARRAWAEILTGVEGQAEGNPDRNHPLYSAHRMSGYRRVREQLPGLLEDVNQDFRTLIAADG